MILTLQELMKLFSDVMNGASVETRPPVPCMR